MNPRKAVCILAAVLSASAPLALAQGTYTQFDVPGSITTDVIGINTQGDISGCYSNANNDLHGFLFSGGTYTTIDYPGMPSGTCMHGLNDFDQVVGEQEFSPFPNFVYDASTQTFTDINCPTQTSSVSAINNAGVIAGSVQVGQSILGLKTLGSKCLDIAPPNSQYTYALGISGTGKVVGWVRNANGVVLANFLYYRGKYQKIVIPNAINVVVEGINPAGTAIVGYYNPSQGITAGFLYQNKILTTLQFPGSNATFATGINAAGEVVGDFVDASGIPHGFTWTPPGDAAKK